MLKMQRLQKLHEQGWIPSNITEFFFYDGDGILTTVTRSKVLGLYSEFMQIMRNIYLDNQRKYEEVVREVIDGIDPDDIPFPITAPSLNIEPFSKCLPDEIAKKLNLGKDDDFDSQIQESPKKEQQEELKQGEIERGGLSSNQQSTVASGEDQHGFNKLNKEFEEKVLVNENYFGIDSVLKSDERDGEIDESCIDSSPD